ncbi:MAG: hypothetical protein KJ737_23335 [Proteobacteria bacterium]|nr:hypothetical protein [Pseudomonadota bacterium]
MKNIIPLIVIIILITSRFSYSFADNHIAILLSSEGAAYTGPARTFEAEVGTPVRIYNLEGDVKNASAIMEKIYNNKPSLIYALGAKAAYIAKIEAIKKERSDIPIVFAMVLNWERYDLLNGSDYIAGVSTDLDPGTQFAYLNLFAPHVKKIGVIYSKTHSARKIEQAINVSRLLNLELITETISHHKEFRNAFNKMQKKIDAFWIVTDPVIFTPRNMEWLKDKCINNNIVNMGQSKNIADLGILLAVDIDSQDIGIQSASIAKNIILRNQSPKSIGVMPPLGTELILNLKTANKIGLRIHADAKNIANKIIGE